MWPNKHSSIFVHEHKSSAKMLAFFKPRGITHPLETDSQTLFAAKDQMVLRYAYAFNVLS